MQRGDRSRGEVLHGAGCIEAQHRRGKCREPCIVRRATADFGTARIVGRGPFHEGGVRLLHIAARIDAGAVALALAPPQALETEVAVEPQVDDQVVERLDRGAPAQRRSREDPAACARQLPQQQEVNYPLSNCISCTCCMEVCPQFNDATGFVGAATIAQVKLFNNHPTGKVLKEERLRALAGDGGIQECGYAQNCVEACPKQLPLTNAIADVGRDVVVQKIKDFLRG